MKNKYRKPVPQPEDCHFIVKKEEGKVICIMEDTKFRAVNYFIANIRTALIDSYITKDKYLMPDRFVGIATCSANDEWDEQIGRTIAYNRALKKYSTSFFKHVNTMVHEVDDALDAFTAQCNKYGTSLSRSIQNNDEWVNKKMGE